MVESKFTQEYIFGLNFFNNYYTVFDQEELRVGFAINKYAHPRVAEMQEQWANVTLDQVMELTPIAEPSQSYGTAYGAGGIIAMAVFLFYLKVKTNEGTNEEVR